MDGGGRSRWSPGQGDLPPTLTLGAGASSVSYRSVAACVSADMVVPDGFSAGQQADGGSTLRLEGRV